MSSSLNKPSKTQEITKYKNNEKSNKDQYKSERTRVSSRKHYEEDDDDDVKYRVELQMAQEKLKKEEKQKHESQLIYNERDLSDEEYNKLFLSALKTVHYGSQKLDEVTNSLNISENLANTIFDDMINKGIFIPGDNIRVLSSETGNIKRTGELDIYEYYSYLPERYNDERRKYDYRKSYRKKVFIIKTTLIAAISALTSIIYYAFKYKYWKTFIAVAIINVLLMIILYLVFDATSGMGADERYDYRIDFDKKIVFK